MTTFFATHPSTAFQILLFSPAHRIHNEVWQLLQATVLRHVWLERCNALNDSPSPPPAVTAQAILADFEAVLQSLLHNLAYKSTIRSLKKLKHLSRFLFYESKMLSPLLPTYESKMLSPPDAHSPCPIRSSLPRIQHSGASLHPLLATRCWLGGCTKRFKSPPKQFLSLRDAGHHEGPHKPQGGILVRFESHTA